MAPRLSLDDAMDQILAQARPAALGTILGTPPQRLGSRVGGPALLPSEADWPSSSSGSAGPLVLLAAVNLDEAPGLPGFPASGLLQVFIGTDEFYGARFDDLAASTFHVRYDPPDALDALRPVPRGALADETPFRDDAVQTEGRAVRFEAGRMAPSSADSMVLPLERAVGQDRGEDLYDLHEARVPRTPDLWLGGHPDFTQNDVREDPRYEHHTEVLLQVSVSDAVMFGDSGEAAFLIRPEDLTERAWDRAVYTWDCC